jgi:ribosomal protein S18 acetylase RimI-like enzyme
MEPHIVEADLANPSHAAAVVSVIDTYASDPTGGAQPLPADVRERLVPALRAHPTTLVLLALAGDEPVGIAVCFFGLSTFKARPLLNIHDLAVVPAYRGKGLGRALLRAVEEHARRKGCCKLTLEVQDDNTRARGLYQSFGFDDYVVRKPTPTRFLVKALDDA